MVAARTSDKVELRADEARGPTIERRIGLPSGRAVVGALLITAAALGVFLAYTGATDDGRSTFVIAARDVPAGSIVTADDLTTAPLDLGGGVEASSFDDPAAILGKRLVAPLSEGELVQASSLSTPLEVGPANDFTFRISASRAVNGDLRAGDLIDIYVTSDDGTRSVARGVPLLASPADAGRGDLVLRLAIGDDQTVVAVIDAVNRGDVTVVRSTHADNEGGEVRSSGTDRDVGSGAEPGEGVSAESASD